MREVQKKYDTNNHVLKVHKASEMIKKNILEKRGKYVF
jgi:hypothetical protein